MIGASIASSTEVGLDKLAKHARLALLVIAGVQGAAAALLAVAGGPALAPLIVPAAVTAAWFCALAVWARRSPMPAVIVGAVVWASGVVINIAWGLGVGQLSVLNVILLALFINGYGSARTYNRLKRTLAGYRRPPSSKTAPRPDVSLPAEPSLHGS